MHRGVLYGNTAYVGVNKGIESSRRNQWVNSQIFLNPRDARTSSDERIVARTVLLSLSRSAFSVRTSPMILTAICGSAKRDEVVMRFEAERGFAKVEASNERTWGTRDTTAEHWAEDVSAAQTRRISGVGLV